MPANNQVPPPARRFLSARPRSPGSATSTVSPSIFRPSFLPPLSLSSKGKWSDDIQGSSSDEEVVPESDFGFHVSNDGYNDDDNDDDGDSAMGGRWKRGGADDGVVIEDDSQEVGGERVAKRRRVDDIVTSQTESWEENSMETPRGRKKGEFDIDIASSSPLLPDSFVKDEALGTTDDDNNEHSDNPDDSHPSTTTAAPTFRPAPKFHLTDSQTSETLPLLLSPNKRNRHRHCNPPYKPLGLASTLQGHLAHLRGLEPFPEIWTVYELRYTPGADVVVIKGVLEDGMEAPVMLVGGDFGGVEVGGQVVVEGPSWWAGGVRVGRGWRVRV